MVKTRSRTTLSIRRHKSKIIKSIRHSQVTIVYGEPGFEKTTHIPKFILEAKLNKGQTIAITQPSSISAISMAQIMAQLLHCTCGTKVGYEVEGLSKTTDSTKIVFISEDVFLRILGKYPILETYSVIMLDVAHERSILVDIFLGIFKRLIKKRNDLKLVISSSNVKKDKFSAYFRNAPIVRLRGKYFPVEVIYKPILRKDYVNAAVNIFKNNIKNQSGGDCMIFLPTDKEVINCCNRLNDIGLWTVFGYYESMDTMNYALEDIQSTNLKVIITTHLSEAMSSIADIRCVIDCGVESGNFKNLNYDEAIPMKRNISSIQADERMHLSGYRTKGQCYRMYSEREYKRFSEETSPQIRCKSFSELYQRMIVFGLNPCSFDFIQKPLGRLRENSQKRLRNQESLEDIVTIIALMPEMHLYKQTTMGNTVIHDCYKRFQDVDGDHFTGLNIYKEFKKMRMEKKWCDKNSVDYNTLCRVERRRNEIWSITDKRIHNIRAQKSNKTKIKKLLLDGYKGNICRQTSLGIYVNENTGLIYNMDRNSFLYKDHPQWILFTQVRYENQSLTAYGILRLDSRTANEYQEMNPEFRTGFDSLQSPASNHSCPSPDEDSDRQCSD